MNPHCNIVWFEVLWRATHRQHQEYGWFCCYAIEKKSGLTFNYTKLWAFKKRKQWSALHSVRSVIDSLYVLTRSDIVGISRNQSSKKAVLRVLSSLYISEWKQLNTLQSSQSEGALSVFAVSLPFQLFPVLIIFLGARRSGRLTQEKRWAKHCAACRFTYCHQNNTVIW